MPKARASTDQRELLLARAKLVVLAQLVLGSAHALGGALPSIVVPLAGLALVGLGLIALSPSEPRRASLVPAFILLALAAYTLLQLVPLPMSVLSKLSPTAADTWSRALRPVGGAISWAPLSLDPSATATEALKAFTYAATFLLAMSVGRRSGANAPVAIVALSALTVALSAIAHQLLGATKVYGLYEPVYAGAFARLAPILNPNNLAGYLAFGALCGLALMLARKPIVSVGLTAGGVVLVIAALFRTGSRGGVLVLPLGLLAVTAFAFWARRRRAEGSGDDRELRLSLITAAATLVGGLVLGVVGADTWLWRELLSADLEKLRLPALAWPLLAEHPVFGVGRGAFESAFLAYRPPLSSHATYTHPENFVVQWLAEWGWPVTLAALGAFAWCLRPSKLGAGRSALVRVALVGVGVLLLQNLMDLGLELPAQAIAVLAVLGGLWGDTRRREAATDASPRTDRLALGLAATGTLLALALTLHHGVRSLGQDRRDARELVDAALADPSKAAAARVMLEAQLRRHPADYYFAQLGGVLAWRTKSESPMPWIQRALERGPTIGRTHFLLAEVLASRGAIPQALLELRLAAEQESTLAGQCARTALGYTRDYERLLEVVPPGATGPAVLDTMAANLPAEKDRELRERLDREAIRRDPSVRGPRERLAHVRLASLNSGQEPCFDRELCVEEIAEHARALVEFYPHSSRGQQLGALLAIEEGRPDDARALLLPACNLKDDGLACLALLARVEPPDTLDTVLKRYTSRSCVKRADCAAAWDFAAGTYQGRGLAAQAAGAALRAAQTEPTLERWMRAAELAKAAGLVEGERDALTQAERLSGGDAALRERIEGLRRR